MTDTTAGEADEKLTLQEAAQAVIDWCDIVAKRPADFASSRPDANLHGPAFDNLREALAAQPSASVEALIAEARAKLPDAGPEAIARHLYTYLAANPDISNALWLIQGLKDVIGLERTEQSRIMGDFKDAAPGAAAVAAHDSFLRANPHLNESDPNVRT